MEIDIKLKFDDTGIDATFTTDEEEGVAIGDDIIRMIAQRGDLDLEQICVGECLLA